MSLNIGRFVTKLKTRYVFYDTVTDYVYPVQFASQEDADTFNKWLIVETGVPVNGQEEDVYTWYERFYDTTLRDDAKVVGAFPYRWMKNRNGAWEQRNL